MINELIITITDQQQAELIRRSKAAGLDDDLEFFQLHINEWLEGESGIEHQESLF